MPFCEFELMTYTYFRFVKWFFYTCKTQLIQYTCPLHLHDSAYVVYMSATLAQLSLYSTLAISLHCCQFNLRQQVIIFVYETGFLLYDNGYSKTSFLFNNHISYSCYVNAYIPNTTTVLSVKLYHVVYQTYHAQSRIPFVETRSLYTHCSRISHVFGVFKGSFLCAPYCAVYPQPQNPESAGSNLTGGRLNVFTYF